MGVESIFNAASSIAGAVMQGYAVGKNYQSQRETNEANAENVRETNRINKEINQANLDYNKAMTQLQWERDDNAHQREVADLEAAGLSPLANTSGGANGSPLGAPNPIPMESFKAQAPQLDVNGLIQSILQSKALDETKRHNMANEEYQSSQIQLKSQELVQRANELNLEDKKLQQQISYESSLIDLQSKQLDEIIRKNKKDEELRLTENDTRIMAEESKMFLAEIQSKAGGKDIPYKVYKDPEQYIKEWELYLTKYDAYLNEIEATTKSSGSSTSTSGGASVGAAGVVNVGVNGSGSDSSYSSENISKKQQEIDRNFKMKNPVPVFIEEGKYKHLNY